MKQPLSLYTDDNSILVAMNDNTQKLITVDFIHCLPFELLSLVFRSFPIEDLFECMKVDTLWRYRIQNSPTLWQKITIVDDDDTILIPKLSLIGSYVKSYKIINGSEKAHRSSMNLITCGYLNRLQSLVIHEAGYYLHNNTNIENNGLLLQSIQCLQNTLTELELTWYKRETNSITMTTTASNHLPRLSSLLTACPGLKRLRIDMPAFRINDNINDQDYDHDASLLLLSADHRWQLTHLHWSVGFSRRFTVFEIESILTACPSLTYLKLDPCDDPIPLLTIYQKCSPSLRFLGLNAEQHSDIYEMYWNNENCDQSGRYYKHNGYYDGYVENTDTSNLESLIIPCLNRTDWDNLINLIMINHQQQTPTLQDLAILHHDNFDIFRLAELLQVYRGKQIRLRHTGQRKQYASTVEAHVELISTLPPSSQVSGFAPSSNSNYYGRNQQEQQQQQQQRRHQMTITSTFCRDYMTQCPWFINQLKDINRELLLTESITLVKNTNIITTALVFTQCFILDSCLHNLLEGDFPFLQELHIENCVLQSTTLTDLILGLASVPSSDNNSDSGKKEEKEEQVDKLRPSLARLSLSSSIPPPRMKRISFGSIPGLTDNLVATLAEIPSLKQVTLSCCYSVTDQGVRDLVDKSSIELEQVTIHGCKQVSYVTNEYIQRKLSSRSHHHDHDGGSIVLKKT